MRAVCTAWLGLAALIGAGTAQAFDLDDVAARAKQLAAQPFQKPEGRLPKSLQQLGYEFSPGSPDDFARFQKDDITRAGKIVTEANISSE